MAQKQKTPKPPQDLYSQRGKTLSSSVQRLRGWVGSDPSRTPELADALVELTEHRLLGHGYPAAAADGQEAVRLAAQLLTANGPIGPYTSVADAVRCVTAMVHMAALQVGIGRAEAAGQTIDSVQDLQQQLREVGLRVELTPQTEVWAAGSAARAALAAGDVATASQHADTALARLAAAGLGEDDDTALLAVDTERLVSDCRWAAGRAEESLTHLHRAKERYDALVAGRLHEPARLSPALVERLAEPLFGLHRDLADRLLATGEVDHALAVRRSLVQLLERLVPRLGDAARVQLALALADLAGDLLAADRGAEAEAAAIQAADALPASAAATPVRLLVAVAQARALLRRGRGADAVAALRPVVSGLTAPATPAQVVGSGALADALRATGDPEGADAIAPPADGLSATAALDLTRGVVTRGTQPAETSEVAGVSADTESEQRETTAWLEAERAEAHRLEVQRMEQARVEAERRRAEEEAAERAAAEQLAAEREQAALAERQEAERQAAAEEAERIARKQRREERLEAHRKETEENELAAAEEQWRDARARGDRRAARAANERVVELLRPRAEENLAQYGPHLHEALEELSSARLRSGDLWGSRAPAREARALARALGR